MSKFRFRIHTGDQYMAGTDSNIFVVLVGALGNSEEKRLNQYIGGNAFERNDWNECTIDFADSYEELGTIYKIIVRSDMKYSGAGWLLDRIEVYGKDNEKSVFKISEWIENKSKHEYYDASMIRSTESRIEERNVLSDAIYYVPAGAKMTKVDSTEVVTGYHVAETKITEISTNTSVSAEASGSKKPGNTMSLTAIKAAFTFALTTSNKVQETKSIDQVITKSVSQTLEFPVCDIDKEYKAVYIEEYENFKVSIGNLMFEVPKVLSRKAAGFQPVN